MFLNSISNYLVTCIGYESSNEKYVDCVLDSITNKINISITDINDTILTTSLIRDIKISSILSGELITLVLDLSTNWSLTNGLVNDKTYLESLSDLISKIYLFNDSDRDLRLNLVLLTHLYRSGDRLQIYGGNSLAYLSDYVIYFTDNKIKIMKDRSDNNKTFDSKFIMRNLKLDSLLQ